MSLCVERVLEAYEGAVDECQVVLSVIVVVVDHLCLSWLAVCVLHSHVLEAYVVAVLEENHCAASALADAFSDDGRFCSRTSDSVCKFLSISILQDHSVPAFALESYLVVLTGKQLLLVCPVLDGHCHRTVRSAFI